MATKKWPFYLSPLCCSFPVDYTILVFMTTLHSSTLCNLFQAWWGRERHVRGHHLFSSILGNWLAMVILKTLCFLDYNPWCSVHVLWLFYIVFPFLCCMLFVCKMYITFDRKKKVSHVLGNLYCVCSSRAICLGKLGPSPLISLEFSIFIFLTSVCSWHLPKMGSMNYFGQVAGDIAK